jgi:hypothetical protein
MTSASRPIAILLTAGLLLAAGTALAGPAKRPVVVELYTSQSCDSCPPADALLGRLAQRPGVLAMSFPVTYWDMLGWKDTLASEANTRRQKSYADTMDRGAVYTPQMIIDGISDVVGSREAEVEASIAAHRAEIDAAHDGDDDPAFASVLVSETPRELHLSVLADKSRNAKPATIWLFHLRGSVTVKIGGGENDGRTMTYRNVVADQRSLGQWKGQLLSLVLPRAQFLGLPHDGVAVVVQQGGYGHVIGAAYLDHPDYYAEQ